nr:protein kinase-like domain, phloem protein 2-like protein [Tanacetum cinerariifolium]
MMNVDCNIIIYKKEANRSLRTCLSDPTLTWMQRLKICLGVANALSYIHNDVGRDFSVIHCNIKSSNILLDDKCKPKLSDFKHSLKIPVARRHRLVLTHDIVKNAYLDPKYIKSGGVTHKSDVYSFGGIADDKDKDKEEDENGDEDKYEINAELGEALLSQPAKSYLHDMVGPIGKQMDLEAFRIFSDTSNWCIKEDRADRPYIDQVVKRLQKALELQWKHENPVKLKTYFDLQPHLNDESVIKINGEDKTMRSLVRAGFQRDFARRYSDNKCKFKDKWFNKKTVEQVRHEKPTKWKARDAQWQKLVDFWSDQDRMKQSERNSANRAKNKVTTHQGSKSFAQGRHEFV